MATILNSAIFNSAILDSNTFSYSSSDSHLPWLVQPSSKNCHSLDSDSILMIANYLEIYHLNSFKNNYTYSTLLWWWQTWIHSNLNCTMDGNHLGFSSHSHLAKIQFHFAQKTSLVHSDSTWWWQPSWILPCWIQTLPSWIQTPCYLFSDSFKNTLTPLWLWIKLIQSN